MTSEETGPAKLAMAAGRGEFYRNFEDGLQKTAVQQPQSWGRGKPRSSGKMRKRRARAPQSHRNPVPVPDQTHRKLRKSSPTCPKTKKNLFERLPSEILMKILSYLDATSLYFIGHVNKLFCHLANDDVLWHKIYMSEFGISRPWRTKSVDYLRLKVTQGRSSVGHWKQKYFKALAGQEVKKWRCELKDINPYTGLPRQTEWVLRNLNVSWQLRVHDCFGQEVTLEPSKVYFFETSVIVRWSSESFPSFNQISKIQLHGLRKEAHSVKKPDWHSLMLKLDRIDHSYLIGKDRLIKLIFLSPGFIVGIWRGQNIIAFIMVCLHFHRLVERSLLGSPVSPYLEPMDRPPREFDPDCGLRGYNLHFVLHNTGAEIMSGYFPDLSCRSVHITQGLMTLGVISKNNLSHHRSLSGNIKLPWKTEELEGSIENCCIMTLTLLDEFQEPFWCVSTPISITRSKKSLSFDYNGEHFLMEYHHPEGQVKMKLVWLQEEKQFFLIDLIIYVAIFKVNKYFCTDY